MTFDNNNKKYIYIYTKQVQVRKHMTSFILSSSSTWKLQIQINTTNKQTNKI